jgi:HNH endonuclease
MTRLVIKSGQTIQFDELDRHLVEPYKWHVSHNGYAIRRVREESGRKRVVYMHKEIFHAEDGFDIDHASGDKLDNRRANLRSATRTLNNANSKPRANCSSQFKGVAWLKTYRRWWAYINKGGKRINLGYFTDEASAGRAYNTAAKQLFGEFARLNTF